MFPLSPPGSQLHSPYPVLHRAHPDRWIHITTNAQFQSYSDSKCRCVNTELFPNSYSLFLSQTYYTGHRTERPVLSVPINIHIQGWSDLLRQNVNFILKLIMLNPWENTTHAVWLAVGAVRTFRMCKEK